MRSLKLKKEMIENIILFKFCDCLFFGRGKDKSNKLVCKFVGILRNKLLHKKRVFYSSLIICFFVKFKKQKLRYLGFCLNVERV